jgi:hypothetical protein
MKTLPPIGSKVKYRSRISGRTLNDCTVIRYYESYFYDEDSEQSTNIVEPESEWSVEIKPATLPSWWAYPNNDTFCPDVAELTLERNTNIE